MHACNLKPIIFSAGTRRGWGDGCDGGFCCLSVPAVHNPLVEEGSALSGLGSEPSSLVLASPRAPAAPPPPSVPTLDLTAVLGPPEHFERKPASMRESRPSVTGGAVGLDVEEGEEQEAATRADQVTAPFQWAWEEGLALIC